MTTRTLAVVSAGLSTPSSTRLLADRLTAATVAALRERGDDSTVEVVELRTHARDLADDLVTGFANESLRAAIDTVTGADGLIAVTPLHFDLTSIGALEELGGFDLDRLIRPAAHEVE